MPNCLQEMVAVAETDPEIVMVGVYRVIETSAAGFGLPIDITAVPGEVACRLFLIGGVYLFGTPSSCMYRASAVRARSPRFYPSDRYYFDTETAFQIVRGAKLGFVHQVLTFSRYQPDSITHRESTLYSGELDGLILVATYGEEYLNADEFRRAMSRARRHVLREARSRVVARSLPPPPRRLLGVPRHPSGDGWSGDRTAPGVARRRAVRAQSTRITIRGGKARAASLRTFERRLEDLSGSTLQHHLRRARRTRSRSFLPIGCACHIESDRVNASPGSAATSKRKALCTSCSVFVALYVSRMFADARSVRARNRSASVSNVVITDSTERANSTTSPSGTQIALSPKSRPPNPWKPMTTHPHAMASAGGNGKPSRRLKLKKMAASRR